MKIILTAFCLACLFSFTACGGKKEDKSKEVKVDSLDKAQDTAAASPFDNTCDYYVDRTEAEAMIRKYISDFKKSGLKDQVWLEKCLFLAIDGFLDANTGYDGVRFFWVTENGNTTLLVAPTVESTTGQPYDRHTNMFKIDIPPNGCTPRYVIINVADAGEVDMVNRFGTTHRGETRPGDRSSAPENLQPLSVGIWLARCKIEKMCDVLNTPGQNLDGVMALSAAYYQDDDRRRVLGHREFPIQSTLVFVPTRGNELVWDAVRPPQKWKDTGGLNHGELCPKICE